MSRYIVRVIGPSGMERYLWRGQEIERRENATHYPHPSSARRAMDSYAARMYDAAAKAGRKPFVLVFGVIDTRDPERIVD